MIRTLSETHDAGLRNSHSIAALAAFPDEHDVIQRLYGSSRVGAGTTTPRGFSTRVGLPSAAASRPAASGARSCVGVAARTYIISASMSVGSTRVSLRCVSGSVSTRAWHDCRHLRSIGTIHIAEVSDEKLLLLTDLQYQAQRQQNQPYQRGESALHESSTEER